MPNDLARHASKGRAFFSTPEPLGEAILGDYVEQKRRTRRTAS